MSKIKYCFKNEESKVAFIKMNPLNKKIAEGIEHNGGTFTLKSHDALPPESELLDVYLDLEGDHGGLLLCPCEYSCFTEYVCFSKDVDSRFKYARLYTVVSANDSYKEYIGRVFFYLKPLDKEFLTFLEDNKNEAEVVSPDIIDKGSIKYLLLPD